MAAGGLHLSARVPRRERAGSNVPIGSEVPLATLAQWLRRTMFGAGVTVGMWVLVVVLDGRNASGNGLLTALALAIVAGAAVAIRSGRVDDAR